MLVTRTVIQEIDLNIQYFSKKHNVPIGELCKKTGITYQSLYAKRKGNQPWRLEDMLQISKALKVAPVQIFPNLEGRITNEKRIER